MTANDPLIGRFARACGAEAPLDLQVEQGEGQVLARGKVHQPFTLVGRAESCDVTLTDLAVHLRHCWLQVIEGRVFCIDLGSRSGLLWPSGSGRAGWLDPGAWIGIGPFRLQLRSPASRVSEVHSDFHPLRSDSAAGSLGPAVDLVFRNGKRGRDHWSVNRVITLIGRADDCKIHLNADDVAHYHCGLVLTRDGPWVVDLSGRGVEVDGEQMRVAPLAAGAELRVGRFVMSTRWLPGPRPEVRKAAPDSTVLPGTSRRTPVRPPPAIRDVAGPGTPPPTLVTPIPPLFAEDEVPIGGASFSQTVSGLPSSHIMCDAFRSDLPAGQSSSPILVSGAAPSRHILAAPAALSTRPGEQLRSEAGPAGTELEAGLTAMLNQLGGIYEHTVEQLQQSLLMLVHLCGRLLPDQAPAVLWELTRIQELNAEMARLQGELARSTISQVIEVVAGTEDREPARGGKGSGDPTPPPARSPLDEPTSTASEMIQEWMQNRISDLQEERQARWEVLAALVAGRTGDDVAADSDPGD